MDEGAGRRGDRPVVVASQGQAHYTPSSGGEQIGTLTPQNMSKAIQQALARVAEKHGSVDEFARSALQYPSKEDLYKAFSAEQIDAIALALDNIQAGMGFIIGDQTGIGKGRVVAAMIRYAVMNGKVPVFVTEKQALYADMYRDLVDIGFDGTIVDDIMQTNSDEVTFDADNDVVLKSPTGWSRTLGATAGMPKDKKTGNENKIVFTTYDQLNTQFEKKSDAMAPRRRFIDQLMRSKQVVLIMDEAHNAGGSGDLENLRPNPKTGVIPHPRALFFRQIIPQADGVFYSSATYAKTPDVMDLYSATDLRLGVGGDIKALADTVGRGGIPFQQITAAMLSESGQYMRRERSFEGVSYAPKLYDVDEEAAEQVSSSMALVRDFEDTFIAAALEEDGDAMGSNAVGAIGEKSQNFTSLMHNIINQMLLSLKVKPAVKDAIKILKDGRDSHDQVVLTVSNTMGSFISEYATEMGLVEGSEFKLRFNDLLLRYLYKTREYVTDLRDERGDRIKFWIDDRQLGPDGVRAYQRIYQEIDKMNLGDMPISPVDYMLNELSKAGFPGLEITGRDLTVDYSGPVPVLSRRDPKDRSVDGRNRTIKRFNNGENRVIILNRSGSTGISLHASERNPKRGQGKRTMIVVQAEQDINVHMQMLGRVHRTGQVVTPGYIQAVANIPAEKKPAALLVARMASLSANTTADADNLFSDKNAVNFLNKYGDQVCAQAMRQNPDLNFRLGSPYGMDSDTSSNISGLAKKVTGRLPLLPMAEQETVYNAIEEAYKDYIAELDAMGRNDLEAKTFDLDAQTVDKEEVAPKTGESPFQGAVYAETINMKRIGKPLSTDEVLGQVNGNKNEGEDEAAEAIEAFEGYREQYFEDARRRRDAATNDATKEAIAESSRKAADEFRDNLEKFERLNSMLKVGSTITVDLNMGDNAEPLLGIVIGKVRRGSPKNPLALGSWRVKIAVADGIRIVNMPFSRLQTSYSDTASGVIVSGTMYSLNDSARQFDAALTRSREERIIITGNLFSGYSTFREGNGRIINFTREDGTVDQGVLMPAGFSPQETLDKAPVAFSTFEQVMEFFRVMDKGYVKLRVPGDLRIVANNGNLLVSCDKSVARGGRFFRDDRALLAITGNFFSRGERMYTDRLTEQQAQEVFDMFRGRGNTWFVDDAGLREAREIVNGQPADTRQSETATGPFTPADVMAEMRAELGDGADALIESGAVRIVTPAQARLMVGRNDRESTTAEVQAFRDAQGIGPMIMRKDGSHPTQIASTKSTYRKIFDTIMPESIRNGKILDFGAGKNIGGKEIGADTFEPFPEKGFSPTWENSADIPSNSYDGVINNAVLNVVEDDIREGIIQEIGRVLKPGGQGYINVRGTDVLNAKHVVVGEDPLEVIIDGNKQYQKGWKSTESLIEYLKDVLGPGFTVRPGRFGAVSAVIEKNQAPISRQSERRKVTQAWTTGSGKVYMVQGEIPKGKAYAVLMHELGDHAGQLLHNDKEFKNILASIEKRQQEGSATGEAIRAAMKKVTREKDDPYYWEEVSAYMVEMNPGTTIVRRIIALIKRALLKMGISPDILTAKDITALADIAVRRRANQAKAEVGEEVGDVAMANDNVRSSERKPVFKPVDVNSPEFKRWFKGSAVTDTSNNPMRMYHLSGADFNAFDTGENFGELGSHFGVDPSQSDAIATYKRITNGKTYPVYLSIKNPLRLRDEGTFSFSEVLPQLEDLGFISYQESQDLMDKAKGRKMPEKEQNAIMQKIIKDHGYDGVVYLNRNESVQLSEADSDYSIFDSSDDEFLESYPEAKDSFIAFSPPQIKSAISNTGEFSDTDGRIMYSERDTTDFDDAIRKAARDKQRVNEEPPGLKAADVAPQFPAGPKPMYFQYEQPKNWREKVVKWVKDKIADHRGFIFGAFTLQQLDDIYGAKYPAVRMFYRAAEAIAASTNKMMSAADTLHNKWAKLSMKDSEAMASVMYKATLHQINAPDIDVKMLKKLTRSVASAKRALAEASRINPNISSQLQARAVARIRRAIKTKEARLEAAYQLQEEWAALPETSRKIYEEVRKMHDDRLRDLRDAISAQIFRSTLKGGARNAAMARVKQEFDKQLKRGPYFPLSRFGDKIVIAYKLDENGEETDRVVSTFDTTGEANEFAAKIEKDGYKTIMKVSAEQAKTEGAPTKFAADVVHAIEDAGLESHQRQRLLDEVNQAFIRALPDMSHRKHFIHRKGVEGYSKDALRSFASTMQHAAHHIARIQHGSFMTEAIDELKEAAAVTEGDATLVGELRNELVRREEHIMNPNVHPVAQVLTSMGFIWSIGPSIASAAVNMSQTPLVAYPIMAARYGWKKTADELMKAANQYRQADFSWEKGLSLEESIKLTKDERDMLAKLIEDGVIDVTLAHDLAQAASTDYLSIAGRNSASSKYARAMKLVSWPFHVTEVANRQITALAAYRLAASNVGHDRATAIAADMVMRAHFNYNQANRARHMQGNIARVILLFKQYSQNMTYLLGRSLQQAFDKNEDPEVKRVARAQLAGIIGGHFLFTGAMGMPLVSTVGAVLNTLAGAFGDDDEPWDWRTEMRNAMADVFGKGGGEMISHGPLRALIPWDVSSRVSLGDLWWRESDKELEGNAAFSETMKNLAGPVAGNFSSMFQGAAAMADGEWFRGLEMMMPKAIKDIIKSSRYAGEGVTSWNDDMLIDDLGAADLVGQLVGFTPARVSEMYEGQRAVKGYEDQLEKRRQRLLNAIVRAKKERDTEAAAEAMAEIKEFNRKNPKMAIRGSSILRSMKARARVGQQTKDGVYLPATREELREIGRFAVID